MKLVFLGGAGTATDSKILLVILPFNLKELNLVLLTHAHLIINYTS